MTVALWRIATEAPEYKAVDATGTGARLSGGRWNHKGIAVVYAAPSIALVALETIIHLSAPALPFNRYLIRIDVPDEVWRRRQDIDNENAPAGWDAEPVGLTSLEYGDAWIKSMSSALMCAPSVVIPMEQNVLINPCHPEASQLIFTNTGKFLFDRRIRKS